MTFTHSGVSASRGNAANTKAANSKGGADVLVLSTKIEDSVQIGDDIRITVIDARPRNVRIGIEAPQSIAIRRDPAEPRSRRPSRRTDDEGDRGKGAQPAREQAPDHAASTAVMLLSRDQPLISRLGRLFDQEQHVDAVTVGSITEGKRRIAQQQAIDLEYRPDLVLLDADLSPQTAILFLHWLRQSDSRRVIPVVVLRGESTPHTNAALLTAGANVVVRKDQPADRVERCVRSAIEMWRAAEPNRPGRRHAWQEAVA